MAMVSLILETLFLLTLDTTEIATVLTQVNVYPNPINTTQELHVNFPKRTKASIALLDSTGKLIYKTNTKATLNSLRLPKLSAGLYILQIKTPNQSVNKKIVIKL